MKLAITLVTALACTGCGLSSQQVVKDVTIGLDAAVCVLTTYTADIAKGMTEEAAIANTAITCGVSAAQAGGILAAHKRAEVTEGFVSKQKP
jgi:hypothetical protein